MKSRINTLSLQLLLVMVLFQLARILFIGFNQPLFENVSWLDYPMHMIAGIKFDLAALCMLNAPFIILSLLPFPFCEKRPYQWFLMIIFALTNTMALLPNFVDIFYYPYTLKRLTASFFDYLGTQANMSSLGVEFFVTYWYAYIILGVLIFILMRFFRSTIKKLHPSTGKAHYAKRAIILLFTIFLLFSGSRGTLKVWSNPLTIKDALSSVDEPEDAGIVLNSTFTLLSSMVEKPHDRDYYNITELDSILPKAHHYKSDSTFRPDNVVIIILESFTRETFKSLNPNLEGGKYPGYAPFLDSLMRKSLYFVNASANGRKSMDAVPSVLASIPASQTPFILNNKGNKKVKGLASCLKGKGYETLFFHGSHNSTMDFAKFCEWADIDNYYGLNEYPNGQSSKDFDGTWGIFDEPYLQYMAHKLDQLKKPFISTVFTLSSHNPYVVPEKYEGLFPKGTEGIHETMGYSDNALREFFKTASHMSWYKNTLFVITADHAITPWHKEYATSANAFAIPLMFYAPGKNLKGRHLERAQQIDIYPTVLSYLNYSDPFVSAGNNLLDPKAPKFTVALINQCYQMIQGEYMLLFDGQNAKALYNIKEDHYQRDNILHKDSLRVKQMESLLKAWIQRFHPRDPEKN